MNLAHVLIIKSGIQITNQKNNLNSFPILNLQKRLVKELCEKGQQKINKKKSSSKMFFERTKG